MWDPECFEQGSHTYSASDIPTIKSLKQSDMMIIVGILVDNNIRPHIEHPNVIYCAYISDRLIYSPG